MRVLFETLYEVKANIYSLCEVPFEDIFYAAARTGTAA